MSEIKAAIFDIGGVLIQDPDLRGFWKEKKGSAELRKLFGSQKISKKEFVKRGAKLLEINEKKFIKKYEKAYFGLKPIKPTIKIYENLKIPKYINSDTNDIHLDYLKKSHKKLFSLTGKKFFSSEIKRRKTEISTFRYIAKEIGLKPKELLFIDNTPGHIERAKKAGFNAILFRNASQLKKRLKELNVK